jgi:hypothetical protein
MDVTDAMAPNLPAITAMNNQPQPESATAPRPGGGPQAEGAAGADNAPQPGQGAQANASPSIPHTRPAVALPGNVAAQAGA